MYVHVKVKILGASIRKNSMEDTTVYKEWRSVYICTLTICDKYWNSIHSKGVYFLKAFDNAMLVLMKKVQRHTYFNFNVRDAWPKNPTPDNSR